MSDHDRSDLLTAAGGPGSPAEPVVRPPLHRWLWYAFGGGLPARHRGWVLRDTTTHNWWLRHVRRSLLQLSLPIAVVMVFLPADWGLKVAIAIGGVILSLIYSIAYMTETTEHRVRKAGYPVGTAQAERDRHALVQQRIDSERKRVANAKRAARYRERTGR